MNEEKGCDALLTGCAVEFAVLKKDIQTISRKFSSLEEYLKKEYSKVLILQITALKEQVEELKSQIADVEEKLEARIKAIEEKYNKLAIKVWSLFGGCSIVLVAIQIAIAIISLKK